MTPQDLKQIGSLFDEKFNNIDKRFDGIGKKFDKIDKRFDEVDKNFVEIKADIAVLKYKANKNEKSITKINDNILKWKSEMFDAMDKFMRETSDQREFREVGGYQLASNTHRIGKLETKVFGSIIGA